MPFDTFSKNVHIKSNFAVLFTVYFYSSNFINELVASAEASNKGLISQNLRGFANSTRRVYTQKGKSTVRRYEIRKKPPSRLSPSSSRLPPHPFFVCVPVLRYSVLFSNSLCSLRWLINGPGCISPPSLFPLAADICYAVPKIVCENNACGDDE